MKIIDGEAAAGLMEPLTALVVKAGEAILAVNRAAMRVDGKQDGSPVTEADLAADRIIAEGLAQLAGDLDHGFLANLVRHDEAIADDLNHLGDIAGILIAGGLHDLLTLAEAHGGTGGEASAVDQR